MGKIDPTMRMLWGLAKSRELHMSDEELHILVMAHTRKDSIRKLNKRELGRVIGILQDMRTSTINAERAASMQKGNIGTVNQRKKIYKLRMELGWDRKSLDGMVKKMFSMESVDWLNYKQCSDLIEALKSMAERRQKAGGE